MSTTPEHAAPPTTSQRVAALRDIAEQDPAAARILAWAWFERLGQLAVHERAVAAKDLAELFACGEPSRGIDGPTDGILVAPLIHPLPDAVLRYLAANQVPWLGKRFDAAGARGDNILASGARWPLKLIWPLYSTRPGDGVRIAFDFETRIEPGAAEPPVDVLVIDYAPIASNPNLVVRRIRDELVEIAAGAHLGRILWHQGEGQYTNIGYFALRTPSS